LAEYNSMKRKVSLWVVLLCVFLAVATTFNITYITVWHSFNHRLTGLSEREAMYTKLAEMQNYIDAYYITSFDDAALADGAAAGLAAALPDQWSYYMTAEEYADFSDITLDDYVGIGVQGVFEEEYQAIRVNEVYAEGPAAEAGMRFFDLIIGIDDANVADLGFDESIDRIRGEEGTTVSITFVCAADGETKTVEIKRQKVTETDLHYELMANGLGYIRVRGFNENVDKQFLDAVDDLTAQGAKGLIFDVRLNPGGRLDVLRNMLDPLLPEGTIIESRDKNGRIGTLTSDAAALEIPMAVLVHEYSYSAAEFFAAALQEYDQAIVVGTKTTGKNYSQNTIRLTDGSALVLSTAQYFTPKGVDLAENGVTPDVQVEVSTEELYELFTVPYEDDRQLMSAVDALLAEISEEK